jgi:ParB/RepB/Spo0J family partition protein
MEYKLLASIVWIEDKEATAVTPGELHEVEPIARPDGSIEPRVELIALNLIDQSPYQVRVVDVESESFKELVVSIVESGLINPITVRFITATGRYELIAGHRRFMACEACGMLTAPCYLLKVSDRKAEDMTCCENLNREDLLPIDEALTVKAMLDHGRSREEIAKITGKSVRWVYRREAAARLEAVWIEKAKKYSLSSKFLEFAAALDSTTRENILSKQFDGTLWEDGGNLGMLEKLSMVAHRKLVAAPWMGVCPEECNACKKRTDASELVAEDGESFCLDAECWARHMAELADRAEAKCKAKGIAVKRVSEDTLMEMDVEEARSEEYDTCVLSTTERGEVEIYWGRSLPKAEKLQKKAASTIKKPTEQNVFEMAYAGEVLRRVETLATSETDLHGFLACCLFVGLDMSAFQPNRAKSFVGDERTKGFHTWMCSIHEDTTLDFSLAVKSKFQDSVVAELRNQLEVRNPLDTVSHYLTAEAVIVAFGFDDADVKAAALATIKQAKKRK